MILFNQRILFLLCFLSIYSGFMNSATAQVVAKVKPITVLDELDRVAKDFQVNFIYESSLLSGKTVTLDLDQLKQRKLNEILSVLLEPFSIGYYRVDKSNYALFRQPERGQESTPGDFLPPKLPQTQNELATIDGRIGDPLGRPLGYSTVYLLGNDSARVASTIADSLGRYRFSSVGAGSYTVKVTRLGYHSVHSPIFHFVPVRAMSLQDLVMFEDTRQLSQVSIRTRKPMFEYKADRTIVNLDGSLLGTGLTISDVLGILPGVTLVNDQIGLRGNQGLMVTIDGSQVKLHGSQLISLLRGMPIGSVSQIELIHSPSAKYDAQGRGGFINIKMAGRERMGLSGTFSSLFSLGSRPKFTESAAVSYNSGGFSLYGSYSYQNIENDTELITDNVVDGTSKSTYREQEIGRSRSAVHSGMSGVGYQLNPKNHIAFRAMVNADDNHSGIGSLLLLNGSKALPDSSIRSQREGSSSVGSHSFNINSSHALGSTGHLLSVYADYTKFRSNDKGRFSNSYLGDFGQPGSNEEQIANEEHVDLGLFSAGVDYEFPIDKAHQLEAGGKLSFNHSNSGILFQNGVPNAQLSTDLFRTNNFQYRERISAVYLNYEAKIGSKTNLRLGLRAENTDYTSTAISGDQIALKRYTQVFPNLMLSHGTGTQLFSLSYLRIVGRPTYQDLNPFVTYFSPYRYAVGNQFLKPETTHSLKLGYSYSLALNFALNYNHTDDYLGSLVSLDQGRLTKRQNMDNFGQYDAFELTVNYQRSLFSFWKLAGSASLFHDRYQAVYSGDPIQNRLFGFNLNLMSSLQLDSKLAIDVNHVYRSRRAQLAGNGLGRYRADAALSYGFYQGRANLRISVTDIFYTDLDQGASYFGQISASYASRNENRRFHLGLTFRFGPKDFKAHEIKDNKEQLDRIK